jgi:transcriptional regulator GlxA family with amidase domain
MASPIDEHRWTKALQCVNLAPNGQLFDIAGPLQMFAGANDEPPRPVYRIEIAAPQAGPFSTSSGVRLVADLAFAHQ